MRVILVYFWSWLSVTTRADYALLLAILVVWLLQVMVLCDIQTSHESLLAYG